MAEVKIEVGGRTFEVACRSGEEHFLKSAAVMLNNEASALNDALGRMPEARMLLMAGLMLADKTASLEDQLKQAPQAPQVAAGGADADAEMAKRARRAENQLAQAQAALAEANAALAEAEAGKAKATNQLETLQQSYRNAVATMGNMVTKVEGAAAAMTKAG